MPAGEHRHRLMAGRALREERIHFGEEPHQPRWHDEVIQDQLRVTGVTDLIGSQNIYPADQRVGATLRRAYADAQSWLQDQNAAGTDQPRSGP